MPTYQYSCTECGHFFEVFQSFSEDSLSECPECGGRLRKVFNAVGVVFKGSGFYRTDSRTDSRTESRGNGSGTGASTPAAAKTSDSAGGSSTGSGSTSTGASGSTAAAS